MGYLEFISAMTGHLALPAAVFFGLLLFRRGIAERLTQVTKFKHRDTEIEFSPVLDQVATEIEHLPSANASDAPLLPPPSDSDGTATLIIIGAWATLEKDLRDLARAVGVEARSSRDRIRQLCNNGIIEPTTQNALVQLQRLRNVAARSNEESISFAEAQEYASSIDSLRRHLKWIQNRLNPDSDGHASV